MEVPLEYGRHGLTVSLPDTGVDLLLPRHLHGLDNEEWTFTRSINQPFDRPPLAELIRPTDRVAVAVPDGTRPFPSHRVLPMLLRALPHVPPSQFTILIGTGSHRANTEEELAGMLGCDILEQCEVINHDAFDPAAVVEVGRSLDDRPILLNRRYVEADKRIVMGFIEPHFMAGFSGGYKGVFPALAAIDSIRHYHRAQVNGDPRSTWGRLHDNPTQDQVRHNGSLVPVDFLVNVTLNRKKEITAWFCGEPLAAHEAGCNFAQQHAMVECAEPYDLVLTTNSGFPLDQNLYQAVKGMSAASQIVKPGGQIIMAAECNDGFPSHGNFQKLLFEYPDARSLLQAIESWTEPVDDQWQLQLLALILLQASVAIHCSIEPDLIRRAHMEPLADLQLALDEKLAAANGIRMAVLPEGPQTIPFLAK